MGRNSSDYGIFTNLDTGSQTLVDDAQNKQQQTTDMYKRLLGQQLSYQGQLTPESGSLFGKPMLNSSAHILSAGDQLRATIATQQRLAATEPSMLDGVPSWVPVGVGAALVYFLFLRKR